MRRAIEKLSFFVLSLATASLLSFLLVARLTDARSGLPPELPLLFNPQPRNVRDLTAAAVQEVARGAPTAERAARQLARLGGAALPHALPALDALAPAARGRVALALVPVAVRMGVAKPEELDTPERAVAFFNRFWRDRGADFRSAAVRRKVARLAERALALREKEVIELDTFALGDLLDALGRMRTREDVERAARLTPVLAHVTGMPWTVSRDATLERAAHLATRWHAWGAAERADFTPLDGPGRLRAMVMQTRYYRWLSALPRAVAGDDREGSARVQRVLAACRTTLPLAALSLGLGLLAGAAATSFRDRQNPRALWLRAVPLALSAIPLGAAAVHAAALGPVAKSLILALLVAALIAAELDATHPIRSRYAQALQRLGPLVPFVLAAVLAGEVSDERGLGGLLAAGLRAGDLPLVMWIAFALSLAGALGALAITPLERQRRTREFAPVELRPAPRRAARIVGSLCVLALLGSLAALQPLLGGGPGSFVRALGGTLVLLSLGVGVAAFLGVLGGLFTGGLFRSSNVALRRALELASAVPQPLFAAAAFSFGGLAGAAALGALRSVEIAALLQNRLAERSAVAAASAANLHRAPLSAYLRHVLPGTLAPTATSLVLTIPWLATLELATARMAAKTPVSLATRAAELGLAGVFATVVLSALALAAFVLGRELLPRESHDEHAHAPLMLALKRRIPSSHPPPRLRDSDSGAEPALPKDVSTRRPSDRPSATSELPPEPGVSPRRIGDRPSATSELPPPPDEAPGPESDRPSATSELPPAPSDAVPTERPSSASREPPPKGDR